MRKKQEDRDVRLGMITLANTGVTEEQVREVRS
jgi:hypothetical protein